MSDFHSQANRVVHCAGPGRPHSDAGTHNNPSGDLFERAKTGEFCTLWLRLCERVERRHFSIATFTVEKGSITKSFRRMSTWYDALLRCARRAIDCWSVVVRRCGVAKDIRVVWRRESNCTHAELRMKAGAPLLIDTAEQIKWWDALDALGRIETEVLVANVLRLARECRHPDAQWLASLFPVGGAVTKERLHQVMLEQGEDARAKFVAWRAGPVGQYGLLQEAAEMNYAPALACWSFTAREVRCANGLSEEEKQEWATTSFECAQDAVAQGDRYGMFLLAFCHHRAIGCAQDMAKAIDLYRVAAELGYPMAQEFYGTEAFGEYDWRRFLWRGRAATRGVDHYFCESVLPLLPLFESGQHGRILHTAAPIIRAKAQAFSRYLDEKQKEMLERIFELYDAMMSRARQAMLCWSVVGARCGVAKDVRIMIAKMAWEETWRWGDFGTAEEGKER
jgi:hypothetical protein